MQNKNSTKPGTYIQYDLDKLILKSSTLYFNQIYHFLKVEDEFNITCSFLFQ